MVAYAGQYTILPSGNLSKLYEIAIYSEFSHTKNGGYVHSYGTVYQRVYGHALGSNSFHQQRYVNLEGITRSLDTFPEAPFLVKTYPAAIHGKPCDSHE